MIRPIRLLISKVSRMRIYINGTSALNIKSSLGLSLRIASISVSSITFVLVRSVYSTNLMGDGHFDPLTIFTIMVRPN